MRVLPPLPVGWKAPWLAPLAGFSDLPFRLLCREQGAAVACTEMVSAKGLIYKSPGTEPLLDTCEADSPLVVQLFGEEGRFVLAAAQQLAERGYRWFDINAGCSVSKVVKTGAGAALLRSKEDRQRLCGFVRGMASIAGRGQVGVKYRLGWSGDDDISCELGQALQDAGAGWLCLHPRRAKQMFGGTADWDALARLKQAVTIPVLASGDLLQAADGIRCLQHSGVDGVMYARGALADPRIFARHLHLTGVAEAAPQENGAAVAALLRRHAELAREYGRGWSALLKMRTFAPRYLRGVPGAAALRKRLTLCHDWQELDGMLQELESLPAVDHGS